MTDEQFNRWIVAFLCAFLVTGAYVVLALWLLPTFLLWANVLIAYAVIVSLFDGLNNQWKDPGTFLALTVRNVENGVLVGVVAALLVPVVTVPWAFVVVFFAVRVVPRLVDGVVAAVAAVATGVLRPAAAHG